MSNDALKEIFFEECEELLESLASNLELVSSGEWDTETINAIFRAVHSIKGAAGAFGFSNLVDFAHHYETALDMVRSESLELESDILRLLVRSSDVLAELVDIARIDEDQTPATLDTAKAELIELTKKSDTQEESHNQGLESLDFMPAPLVFEPLELPPQSTKTFDITLTPNDDFYACGHEPDRFLQSLRKLGKTQVACSFADLPTLDNFNFGGSYLSWTIRLQDTENKSDILSKFGFVEGLCDLEVEEASLDEAGLPQDIESSSSPTPSSEIRLAEGARSLDASADQKVLAATARPTAQKTTLRVDPERVDRLINSVGELIINHAVIDRNLQEIELASNTEMMAALDDYGSLARDIQEAVMAIRAQPVKSLFQRMGRVVREASEATGKNVSFISDGESTEIDKTMLERLSDPLTHMLRNAVDHGIESPDKRIASGKDLVGRVRLSASHKSGHVVIEISDDGAGLDRDRILKKAVQKNLIAADASLTESEIYALLFAPGFSTAENVTNLSGRGVGMDVVKTAITSLGGKVGISSTPGKGSVFSITLPLTLAVLDGMIVDVCGETMVLPLSSIVETVRGSPNDVHETAPGEYVLSIRNSYVPIVNLASILSLGSGSMAGEAGAYVLLDANDTTFAVSVDSTHDQRQVVIKSLKENYGVVRGISAATILGDGNVALILDPDALLEISQMQHSMRSDFAMEDMF